MPVNLPRNPLISNSFYLFSRVTVLYLDVELSSGNIFSIIFLNVGVLIWILCTKRELQVVFVALDCKYFHTFLFWKMQG